MVSITVKRDVQFSGTDLMTGGQCRLEGVSEDCRGGRNTGEKFLEVVNTWMNLEVSELFSRKKKKKEKKIIIFCKLMSNNVEHVAQYLVHSQCWVTVSSN